MNGFSSFRQACGSILGCLLIIVTLFGCGGSGGGETGSAQGSLAFKLSLADSAAQQASASNSERELAELACETQLIDTIEAEVLHNGQIVAEGGPWSCSAHKGTIDGVPAGSGLKLVVYAMNEDQKAIFKGNIDGLAVAGGKATDAGTILLERLTNRPPILNPIGNRIVNENESLTINLSASDLDGDNLTFTAALLKNGERTSLPPGAVLSATRNGIAQFQWTPGLQTSDNYQILFTVTDDGFVVMDDGSHKLEPLNDSESIVVTVGDMPVPPELAPIGNKITTEGGLLEFDISASDPDEVNVLTFSAENMPPNATLTPKGYQPECDCWTANFKWLTVYDPEPNGDDTGTYLVNFKVTDSSNNGDEELIEIKVKPNNPAEILSFDIPKDSPAEELVDENENFVGFGMQAYYCDNNNDYEGCVEIYNTLEFSIKATDQDPNDILTFSAENLPVGAIFNQIENQTAQFRLNVEKTIFEGENNEVFYYVTFRVKDDWTPIDKADFKEILIVVYKIKPQLWIPPKFGFIVIPNR